MLDDDNDESSDDDSSIEKSSGLNVRDRPVVQRQERQRRERRDGDDLSYDSLMDRRYDD